MNGYSPNNANRSSSSNASSQGRSSTCCTFLAYLYQTCQSVLVLILTVAVTVLGWQVHALFKRIQAEDQKIADLLEQVQNQHDVQENLNERVEQEHSLTLYQMAGTFTLLTCLLTAFHMTQHLGNFQEAVVQRKILAILWMSPVYSLSSFLSLIFPMSDGYLAVLKDFYEAYVVYTFLSFLIAVLGRGDREAAVRVLARRADHLKPPTRCLSSCYHPDPSVSKEAKANAVLMECQIHAMQFVLVRPITSILKFLCQSLIVVNEDDPYHYFKSPNFYIAMITNVSVFFAFNGLLKFYHAVASDLKWCRPFSKFMSIKGIVFLTFWQGLLISILFNLNLQPSAISTSPTSAVPSAPEAAPPSNNLYFITLAPSTTPLPINKPPTGNSAVVPSTPAPTMHPTSMEGVTINVLEKPGGGNGHGRSLESNNQDSSTPNNGNEEDESQPHATPEQVQNFLICLEMLFFSIAHWCVFPAEEWNVDYRPKKNYVKPGIALKDFASDISYIVSSSSSARRYRKGNSMSAAMNDNDDEDEIVSISSDHAGETELTAMEHEML